MMSNISNFKQKKINLPLSESGEITLLDRSVKFVDDDDVGGGADGPVMIDDNVDVKRR